MTIVITLGGNAFVHDEHESILDQLAEVERFRAGNS